MTDLSDLKLYLTKAHACSYLPGEQATTVFVDPNSKMDGTLYGQLSDFGFRRSGPHVYRPKCNHCQACIPIRILVDRFRPTRSQKRCIKNNSDLKINICDSIDTDEHYRLYKQYIEKRHSDGDMYPPSRQQYLNFLTSEWGITQYVEFRFKNRLLSVSVTDVLDKGLSAIYAFFDPNASKRSLGVFNILYQIRQAKELHLPFVYLGYWIKNCQKMSYKTDYRPFQVLVDNRWITVSDDKAE